MKIRKLFPALAMAILLAVHSAGAEAALQINGDQPAKTAEEILQMVEEAAEDYIRDQGMGILNYLRLYDGPYPFLRVHHQPWYMTVIWFVVLAGAAYGIAVLLRKLCRKENHHGESIAD